MTQIVKLSDNTVVKIKSTPFASGGEADVHEILSPASFSNQVIKIYRPDKRTKHKEEKLRFLVGNKPDLTPLRDHHSVIWPTHLAYVSDQFAGYTMPKASGIKLELLCHPKLPKSLPGDWTKFSFEKPGAIEARLKLCYNISAALSQIHAFGSYVLVDMKPDNVMVKPDGLISIIDIDSTEIIKNNSLLFPAQVATPEYTPPEFYKTILNIEKNLISETWDRFSIAVIFYRILFGIHPYTASLKTPFENLTNISDIIQKGFLPVGKTKDRFRTIPPPHKNFIKINKNVQNLFLTALEEGTLNPIIRPSANDWCRILSPDPGIRVNRKLPSESIQVFLCEYSATIDLPPIPTITIKKPTYLDLTNTGGIMKTFMRIFKNSEKEQLHQEIISLQNQINEEIRKIDILKNHYEIEKSKAENEIAGIQEKEKVKIKKIRNTFIKKSKVIDLKAKALFREEAEEYLNFEKNILDELNSLENKLTEEENLTVKPTENKFIKEREKIYEALSRLNKKEADYLERIENDLNIGLNNLKNEIKLLQRNLANNINNQFGSKIQEIESQRKKLNKKENKLLTEAAERLQIFYDPANLSQFKIADERNFIFIGNNSNIDKIIKNLAIHGIVTAYDIRGIDESGRILRPDGVWAKIPEIGPARAQKLNEWRKKKKKLFSATQAYKTLPQSEIFKIKSMIDAKNQLLNEEERLLNQKIAEYRKNAQNQISTKVSECRNMEKSLKNQIDNRKLNWIRACKIERDSIQLNLNNLLNRHKEETSIQKQIYDKKTLPLKKRLNELNDYKIKFYKEKKSSFDLIYNQLINDLLKLNSDFSDESEKTRNLTHRKITEEKLKLELKFNEITKKIKTKIDDFNLAVNLLISKQAKYIRIN